jgi:outer membrane immunogenic protein
MKRILIASALALAAGGQALAADLPPPPPAPRAPATYIPVAPYYNWTGFYIGGNLGAAFTSASFSDTLPSTFTNSSNTTFLRGGQVGINYEFWGGVVVGAEAMFDWAPNQNNTVTATLPGGFPPGSLLAGQTSATGTFNNRWLTTATGKLGYAWDRVLLYGKGGGAWVGTNNSSLTLSPSGTALPVSSGSNNNLGWTAGVGVEWAFWGTWSARAEYDYIRLNNQTYTVTSPTTGATLDTIAANNRTINMVTAGVNYKFGPW